MTNNDILRRIRYVFDFNDTQMMAIFAMGGYDASRAQISDWLKKIDEPTYQDLADIELAIFLNGLIIDKRGKKEDDSPVPERRLTNNIVLRKLKIALTLQDGDMQDLLGLAGMKVSKHELSAFFRNPTQPQYRPCEDQLLRNFLRGLQMKYRGKADAEGQK